MGTDSTKMDNSSQTEKTGPLSERWERVFSLLSRLFVWGLLFLTIYFLRSFFLLIFLTFVFAFLQHRGVTRLEPLIKSRLTRVIAVGLFMVALVFSVGAFILPSVKDQAVHFANNYPVYLQSFDKELFRLAERYPVLSNLAPQLKEHTVLELPSWSVENSPSAFLLQALLGFGEASAGGQSVDQSLHVLRNTGAYLLAIASAFLLSLLFSFLIVLDLPSLSRGVRALEKSKLQFVYLEVADSVYSFTLLLGQALEAQFFIALANTILTAVGLWFLGLTSKIAFLSMIVFFCSFIPIAGVFISSVPICLLALQSGGVTHLLLAILLITVIHLIEGYVLNPRIFGRHLHLNPVLVLIILTIGGKLFGIWGLVLGLPICTYILNHAIQLPAGSARPGEARDAIS